MLYIFIYTPAIFIMHNIVHNYYPYDHEFEKKYKNIIESFNIINTFIVCKYFYNFLISCNNAYDFYETNTSVFFAVQLLISQLIYETYYYFIVLKRKDILVLAHHIYTIGTLLLHLIYPYNHYVLSMVSLVEFSNIFLSSSFIAKRNNFNIYIIVLNEALLIISYTITRIIMLFYILFYSIINYQYINEYPVIYLNGLMIQSVILAMSTFWYGKILNIFKKDYGKLE